MALNDGTDYNPATAKSEVNEATDTVYGQLQKHTDFKSPVMQRVSQQAKTAATARGLGNTTIAGTSAIGAVVDKAGEFATKDAEIYSARRTANQQAGVQLESTAMGNRANIEQTNLTNANRIEVQDKANAGALEQIASKGALDASMADKDRLSKETISQNEITGQQTRLEAELASLESRAAADNSVKLEQTYAEIDSKDRLGFLDSETKLEIAKLQNDTELLRESNDSIQGAWDNYQVGLNAIDTNANWESQRNQAKRLKESFQARMEFLNGTAPVTTTPTTTTGLPDGLAGPYV